MNKTPEAEPQPPPNSRLREATEVVADALLEAFLKDRRRAAPPFAKLLHS